MKIQFKLQRLCKVLTAQMNMLIKFYCHYSPLLLNQSKYFNYFLVRPIQLA